MVEIAIIERLSDHVLPNRCLFSIKFMLLTKKDLFNYLSNSLEQLQNKVKKHHYFLLLIK